jgi:Family of unknown function (DUF5923)
MQADMRDVAFYYHKKSGIPKMKGAFVPLSSLRQSS